ncbi:MAG: DUF4268 domain-containing protein [Candidatus Eisenbacteria sp.]|nr:DUF4268 domain-containing protein [Candidatus Eisenbacteria bacterium]
MKPTTLGQLERVNPESYWKRENRGFTAWLAEEGNIKLLGTTLGIELELQAREKTIGPFRADILCRDIAADSWVLVETQMGPTNYAHLGQLLTHAAGLNAVTIVWIAERFTQEHRAAIDWLNEATDEHLSFFGLEIELWRIGNSPPAPKFNAVCIPNRWTQGVMDAANLMQSSAPDDNLTEIKKLQRAYWQAFRSYLSKENSLLQPGKVMPVHWMSMSLGRSGFGLNAVATRFNPESESQKAGEIRTEVVITHAGAKVHFALLEDQREEIEHALGERLTWYDPPEAKYSKIILRRAADVTDRRAWPEQHAWLKARLEAFYQIFAPRIRGLSLEDLPERSEECSPLQT